MGSEEDKGGHTKSISSFLSGGLAGVVAKTMIAPIERVKFLFIVTHLIARKTSNRKFTYDLFRSDLVTIVKNHGITNLWRGNIMNIARVFPTAAIVYHSECRTLQYLTFSGHDSTSEMEPGSSRSFCISVEPLQESHR